MADKVFVGDVGTAIILDCGEDVSGGSNPRIAYQKPSYESGASGEWVAEVYQSNYLKYVTVDGDLDEAGDYRVQAKLTLSGWTGRGETALFKVYGVFQGL